MNTTQAIRSGTAGMMILLASGCGGSHHAPAPDDAATIEQGKQIFRFDTFGDEAQWTDTLRMHEVIASDLRGARPGPDGGASGV